MNKNNLIRYEYGLIFPFFLKKIWIWFADPQDVKKCAMVNYFSYNKKQKPGFKEKKGVTTVIDLNQGLEEIFSKMRKKFVVKQIRKGERNGIKVIMDNNYKEFKKIYGSFRKQKKLSTDKINVLKDNSVFFSAYYQGKMLAGGIFIANNDYMRAHILASLHVVSNPNFREIIGQANRMLIWEAIKYAKDRGLKLFDLGGIDLDSQNKEKLSLNEFKESFGGFRKECYYYNKVYSPLLKFWIKFRNKLVL